jgi:flagellar basal-body rod modification protein FlgD
MSSIPTTPESTSTGSTSATTTPTNPSSSLGESDFLQLLVAQLQYQDPMDPTDDQSFIQEQAQFSTVEGITNMESTLTGMGTAQQMSAAVNLIGANVQYTASDGSTQSGTVSSAANTGGAVTVQVGSDNVDPSNITQVSFPTIGSTGGSSSDSGSGAGD